MAYKKTGFKFKGIHTSDMNVTFATDSRPILPEQKVFSYDVPSVDFEYDMTPNRPRYKTRSFSVVLYIQGNTLDEIQNKAAHISNWLQGKGELIFDDTADVKWDARVISDVGMALEAKGHAARLTVVFKVDVGKATFKVQDGLILNDPVRLDAAIPLDTTGLWDYPLIAGDNNVNVMNIGNYCVRPIFKFPNGIKHIVIECDGALIECDGLTTDTIIDCERYYITNENGDNLLGTLVMGDFPELQPNNNKLKIYVDKPCLMVVDFEPHTLYEFTFSNLEWGDDNAATM